MRRPLPKAFRPRAIMDYFRKALVTFQREPNSDSERDGRMRELQHQAYLALFASFEGTLRIEFDHLIQSDGSSALADRCRALRKRLGAEHARLDEILDCWNAKPRAQPGIQLVSLHRPVRDWLAHGRVGRLPDNGPALLDVLRLYADLEKAASTLALPSLNS